MDTAQRHLFAGRGAVRDACRASAARCSVGAVNRDGAAPAPHQRPGVAAAQHAGGCGTGETTAWRARLDRREMRRERPLPARTTPPPALAADLQAWLERRPITAAPARAATRAKKFIARNMAAVVAVLDHPRDVAGRVDRQHRAGGAGPRAPSGWRRAALTTASPPTQSSKPSTTFSPTT